MIRYAPTMSERLKTSEIEKKEEKRNEKFNVDLLVFIYFFYFFANEIRKRKI